MSNLTHAVRARAMRRVARAKAATAVLVGALLLGGCAGLAIGPSEAGPAHTPAGERARKPGFSVELRRAQATHELPSPAAPEHAAGSASAVQAIRRFAERYINWSAANVAARMHGLARTSVGQARSEMALTAAQVHADRTLSRAGIANRGTVEAVAALPRRGNRYVVVTRERTTARYTNAYQGLAPAWHVILVTVARVTGTSRRDRRRGPLGWVVSVWQPQS